VSTAARTGNDPGAARPGPRARLELQALDAIPEVVPGTDLAVLVIDACAASGWALRAGDCIALAQKIVSKSEGRFVFLDEVRPGARALELAATCRKDPRLVELVLAESVEVVRAVPGVLITEHRLGHVMANAGVDQSNVPSLDGRERALMLPLDPDASARALAQAIAARAGVAVSVLINDSFGRPWREGVCGTAIGAWGLPALVDRRGAPDREGRPMQVTQVALADEVAAAASALMGQTDEGRPVVAIRGLPFDASAAGMRAVFRARAQDLFR